MDYNYNSSREKLIMKEYGRNIQYLVQHAMTIQDPVERNNLVQDIIELMGTLNPALRNVEDYRHKLWDHIFAISDFRLEAESPYPIPDREELRRKNMQLKYPKENVHFRHYGRYVESMIKQAISMEDPEKQEAFTEVIGNYMKLVYQNWNRENVTDDLIKSDLEFLSGGKLTLHEESNLDTLSKANRTKQGPNQQQTQERRQGGRYQRNFKQNKNRNFKRNR
ncbi:MAG: DUF4290 domain-containing protein [Chitinophagales bacterium]|nr:DUF4290 domain-containing protein [Chitinophagales bacterium]HAE13109.1 DUF4290 domain-containing protein [Bacteroidota bacterium]MCB9021232.1 DUF4290 domain-containing protein [Chitinophagales bacterium]HPE96955.1 DUF4290 domain-containing protein [Chitinophagales bacterium]HPR28886.1 DUF4290 domain-containing protein [Chitinophagales bacterium]